MSMRGFTSLLSLAVGLADALGATDTITWGGDNSRANYQSNHNMDPAIVASDQFDLLFEVNLPGSYLNQPEDVYSQPLVYTPLNDTTQYVYWATTQNNVYKMNAKTGEIVASRNLHVPFQQADLDGCTDIEPFIGITGTGVIDPDTDTLYVVAKTYENQHLTIAQGRPAGRQYIHAIDVNTLEERANFPINLEGLVPRNSPTRNFNGGIQHQRPGLLHAGQYIYAGFGSHCVQYNFTGWLIGWDKTTGELVEHWATEGEGVSNTIAGGSLWMSGGGIASDDKGSIYFATGNGYASQLATIPVNGHNPPTAIEEAAVHMTITNNGSINFLDFFMPWNKQVLDGDDKDLGVTPLEVLPSEFTCGEYQKIGVVTDKFGLTYFLNLDDLGGYRNGPNNLDDVIQSYQNEAAVYSGAGVYPLEGGYVYISAVGSPTHAFKFSCSNGVPSFTHVGQSLESGTANLRGMGHNAVTTLNNEPETGLIWITDVRSPGLRIYDAVPSDGTLKLVKSFEAEGVTKFTNPSFGDGIVYIGTTEGKVYAFGAPVTPPLNCTDPVSFGKADIGNATDALTVSCTAVVGLTVGAITLNDTNFILSGLPTLPLTLQQGQAFSFKASFTPTTIGLISSDLVVHTTNGVGGFSTLTSSQIEGIGESQAPLLTASPSNLTWSTVTTGLFVRGVNETFILSNLGNSDLTITSYEVSDTGVDGTFVPGTSTGKFSFFGLPSVIAANTQDSIIANFNSNDNGTFTGYLKVISDGGDVVVAFWAHSGPSPTTLVEFQAADGSTWVPFVVGQNFTFGNVTENTTRSLKLRITNNAPTGANALTLTVSKPPFGLVGSIIQAVNDVDLGEGTSIEAGQSQTATLYCTVPKAQWNTDSYTQYASWTINTNDDNFGKHSISFACSATSEQAAPLNAAGQGLYRYVGCFKENNPGRQLSKQLYSNPNNTNEMCIAACADGGYAYCGTQYNVECWAGPTIPAKQVAETDCNYACGGDLNQICGGNGVGADAGGSYITLFGDKDIASNGGGSSLPSGGPYVNPGIDGYVSLGCYQEPSAGRALQYQFSNTNQTVEACLASCAGQYVYAGLEYGGECWCDNKLSATAMAVDLSACSLTCNGNSSEYCGAGSHLNLYQMNGIAQVSSAISTTSIASASSTSAGELPTGGPYVNPGIRGYVSLGCYTEATTGRALQYQQSVAIETVSNCLDICAGTYLYAGLEYGGECWCGNTLGIGVQTAASSECSMVCNGNQTEYCGASLRLNMYQMNSPSSGASSPSSLAQVTNRTSASLPVLGFTSTATLVPTTSSLPTTSIISPTGGPYVNPGVDNYEYLGCYIEPQNDRALQYQQIVSQQTVSACLGICAGKYTYAGLEYGGECWCGDTLNIAAHLTADMDCSMTCNNNKTEYCGAGLRLSLYQMRHTDLSLPSGTSSVTLTESSSAGGNSSFGSVVEDDIVSLSSKIASTSSGLSSSITTSTNTSTSTNIGTSTESNISTSVDPSQSEGSSSLGTTHLSVSSFPKSISATTTLTSSTLSTVTRSSSASTATPTMGYYLVGCFQDNADGHVLPQLFANKSMTPELCIAYANSVYDSSPTQTARLPYVYLEYHAECYGGTSLDFSGSAVTSLVGTKACSDVCSGSISTVTSNGRTKVTTETANKCGGPRQFNLYALSLPVALPTSSGPVATLTAN